MTTVLRPAYLYFTKSRRKAIPTNGIPWVNIKRHLMSCWVSNLASWWNFESVTLLFNTFFRSFSQRYIKCIPSMDAFSRLSPLISTTILWGSLSYPYSVDVNTISEMVSNLPEVIQQVSDRAGIRVQIQPFPTFMLFSRHKESSQGIFQVQVYCEAALDGVGMWKMGSKVGFFFSQIWFWGSSY